MNRMVFLLAAAAAVFCCQRADAQVAQVVYYGPAPVFSQPAYATPVYAAPAYSPPVAVTTYYAPAAPVAVEAPFVRRVYYSPAPTTVYYAPVPVPAVPILQPVYRPLVGSITRVRTSYPPVVYSYPATTVFYRY